MTRLLNLASIAVGLLGLTVAYLVWTDYQAHYRQISSDIAQMKLSLQLFNQRAPQAAAVGSDADSQAQQQALTALSNRLAILEEAWRHPSADLEMPDPQAEASAPATPAGATDDCIPVGTRFLLSPGDGYVICGTDRTLTLSSVGEGVAEIEGLGSLAEGALRPISDSKCSVVLVSTMADSGFAEVRVTC